MRDGSVMAHSDLVDFLSGSTDYAINFSGSADLQIPIHPPPVFLAFRSVLERLYLLGGFLLTNNKIRKISLQIV